LGQGGGGEKKKPQKKGITKKVLERGIGIIKKIPKTFFKKNKIHLKILGGGGGGGQNSNYRLKD